MKRRILGILLALLAACAPRPSRVTAVTIVTDPGPFRTLEEAAAGEARVNWWDADPRDDDACTAAYAAAELRRFLPACLGVPREAVRLAAALPDTGDVVVLGVTGRDARLEALAGTPRRDAIVAGGFRVRALARGGRRLITIAGDDRAGVLYGAYALLERLGARFYGLGDTGTVLPRAGSPWPRRLALAERPAFETRGFWAWEPRGHPDLFAWMARNRMNLWTAADTAWVPVLKKLGFTLSGGGHTVQADFLPPSRSFAAHPEWFGLHGGRRSPAIHGEAGDNFCTSNPEARRALAAGVVRALEDGSLRHVDVLELWMLDGGRWCECDACRAQGSPTDRTLDVAQDVATAVEEARARGVLRPVEVATLAYLETLPPPRRPHSGLAASVTFFPYFRCYAHALADSTCTEVNRRLAAAYRGWEGVSRRWGVCEYYNVGAFKSLPLVFPHVMARDLAWYRHHGATRFAFMHAPSREWGAWTLNHWLLARWAWSPEQDPDTLVARFSRDYFGPAANAMIEHYRELEVASANILALQHCVGVYGAAGAAGGRLAEPRLPLFPLRHLQATATRPTTDDAPDLDEIESAVRRARAALDRARAGAGDSAIVARLAAEERRFAYGEAMFGFYAALIHTAERHRAGDGPGARAAFASAERTAAALARVKDLVQVAASHANAPDGLEASGVTRTYEFFRARYGTR